MRAVPPLLLGVTGAAAAAWLASMSGCGGAGDGVAPGAPDSATADDLAVPATDSGSGGDACTHTVCNGACVDTSSDRKNCGSCGKVCPGTEVCSASACTSSCTSAQTDCAGVCVDTPTDVANCGGCGKACPAGQVCSASGCHKPGDIMLSIPKVASNGAPAIDAQGFVYTVGIDGFVRKLDPAGTVVWTSSTSVGAGHSHYYAWGGVALGTAMVYAGGTDGYVHAFDPSGKFMWKAHVGGDMSFATPALGGAALGGAVIGAGGNGTDTVVAIEPDGGTRWTYQLGGGAYSSSPAVGTDGTTYLATWNDGMMYAVDATGQLKWKVDNGGGAVTSPALGQEGTIYNGNHSDGIFRAFNPDGGEKWRYTDVGDFHGGSALDNEDTVYIGNDTELIAMTTDGQLKWRSPAGTLPIQANGERWVCGSNSLGDDGKVYVPVCGSYSISVFEPGNGALIYEVQLDQFPGPLTISLSGVLYVGTTAGTLYGIAVAARGPMQGSAWPKHHRDLANTGQR